jgi:methyl-accepting chemotaxis protein
MNLTIQRKLILGFTAVAVLCAIVGYVGWNGVGRLEENIQQAGRTNFSALQAISDLKESQLTIKVSERTLLNASLDLEKRREEYEQINSAFQRADSAINSYKSLPHSEEEIGAWQEFEENWAAWRLDIEEFVKLSSNIDAIQIRDPQKLAMDVERNFGEYRTWAAESVRTILEQQEFSGNLDSENSSFGKWLASVQVVNQDVQEAVQMLKNQLTAVYFSVNGIADFLSIGEYELAKDEYILEVLPSIESIQIYVDRLMAPINQALEYYRQMTLYEQNVTAKSMLQTEQLLNKIVVSTNTKVSSGVEQGEAIAKRVSNIVLAVIPFSFLAALIFGIFIARSISLPLKNVIDVIGKISQGDTSTTLPVGDTANCSSIKNCGEKDCPSYGKEDACWVNSGSFAAIKHCPRAKKGEDCRSCEIYGNRTELEELGSIVMALSNIIKEREQLAESISEGDLIRNVEIASDKDTFGKSLKLMQESLADIIGKVQAFGDRIADESVMVSNSSQTFSQAATEQASSLEEISSSMAELDSQTRNNAENAARANDLTEKVKNTADSGNQHMQAMIDAMQEINLAGQNISKINKVIDEIAFQTNLLALNAAVEAARAGKHGRGFAVVAQEVRNLAARSAAAARETSALIEGTVEKTRKGTEIASTTAEALSDILAGVSDVSELVAEIANASNEQAQGISQVNHGLVQLDRVTQQNTANAEETAAASEELSSQAEQLRQMLSHFKLRDQEKVQEKQEHQRTLPGGAYRMDQQAFPKNNFAAIPEEYLEIPESKIVLDDREFGKY